MAHGNELSGFPPVQRDHGLISYSQEKNARTVLLGAASEYAEQ